jgi:hypothetical protein
VRNFFKTPSYIAALVVVFLAVISCEEDFTDIGSSIISNTAFSTNSIFVDVEIENSPVTRVITSDFNITDKPEYLLGVHATADYEKIEASIISQIAIDTGLKLVDKEYKSDTTVVTTIDTVFVRVPYRVRLNDEETAYELDSIIGNQSKAFNLNIYQSSTYLNSLDPVDPSKLNSYSSDDVFEKQMPVTALNDPVDFQFIPKVTDTAVIVKRWLSDQNLSRKDTVTFTNSSSLVPLPFGLIPIKEEVFNELFLKKYESAEFASQEAFNDYFRGLILEASGNDGSLISFDFNGAIKPSIEVYYTNTVLKGGNIVDTIHKNDRFLLSGIKASTYKMEEKTYPVNNEVKIQGASGSEAAISLFKAGEIAALRDQNLLINDASLTLYINQSADISAVPYQLFLYKSDEGINPVYSYVKDFYTEGPTFFGGLLERDSDGNPEKYTFRITDYVSDILSGETDYSPVLRLKTINKTDLKIIEDNRDTVFTNYNWNPKAVTIFNHHEENGIKKLSFKISYSEKQD